MKITITLSDAEVRGIRKYHQECFDERLSVNEISQYIEGIVNGVLHAPQEAVSSYIKTEENKQS